MTLIAVLLIVLASLIVTALLRNWALKNIDKDQP